MIMSNSSTHPSSQDNLTLWQQSQIEDSQESSAAFLPMSQQEPSFLLLSQQQPASSASSPLSETPTIVVPYPYSSSTSSSSSNSSSVSSSQVTTNPTIIVHPCEWYSAIQEKEKKEKTMKDCYPVIWKIVSEYTNHWKKEQWAALSKTSNVTRNFKRMAIRHITTCRTSRQTTEFPEEQHVFPIT